MTPKHSLFAALLLCLCLTVNPSFAQKGSKKGKDSAPAAADKKEAPKPLKEFKDKCKIYPGLFDIYQDTVTGETYLLIKQNQLNKEYIHFSFVEDGVVHAGHIRGIYRGSRIFSIERYFGRIDFYLENTGYWFDPGNALSRASGANINRPMVASEKIAGINKEKNEFLVKADNIFLKEAFQQVKPSARPGAKPGEQFDMGKLSDNRCKVLAVHNYPANTDVVVQLVYEQPYPVKYGGNDVTDARFVSVALQHSLIEVPQNDFQPRFDDPRVGYFTQQVNDMTGTSATPWRDVINRWHLVKKDPAAPVSEPVEPITWWIENTTPKELRETIKQAALQWNIPFEAAGFKNAMVVKEQPDDADWEAGDIRYNVLRWTSSPSPSFGGYGPSFVNPRTGQILGADVMLEWVFLTNRVAYEELFDAAAMDQEALNSDPAFCTLGLHLQQNAYFGRIALGEESSITRDGKLTELTRESLYYLIMHELGHTLGLNHNMKATNLHPPADLHNKAVTEKVGLQGSVMDYPALNLALDRQKQGQYSTTRPGPYDSWAIEFGYSPAVSDIKAEAARLQHILSRSTEPALMFGNDADDMRSPGMGLDPRVMIGDMSSDAITWATGRMQLANKLLPGLKDKYSKDGQSYHALRNAYLILTGQYATAARVISRYVGGVYVDRSMAGQEGSTRPYTPVPRADQKRAMKALADYSFAPDAFKEDAALFAHLQMQRRGFGFYGHPEDPRLHDRVLAMHKDLLSHLLHPNVQERFSDIALYGSAYPLSEMMNDLTDAILKADLRTAVNTFRQNLQVEYVNRLVGILHSGSGGEGKAGYDHVARGQALYQLNRVKDLTRSAASPDESTRAHRQHVTALIEKALEDWKP